VNTAGYVLTGQKRCVDASEALATIAEWLSQAGDCRVFVNRMSEQVHVEMWRSER